MLNPVILKQSLYCCFLLLVALLARAEKPAASQAISVPHYGSFERISEKNFADVPWVLPLSKYQKVDGFWRLTDSLYLNGQLSQRIFLIRSPDSFKKITDFYQAWARQESLTTLFSCEARSCGYSNDWANRFFKERRLNGLSGKQLFLVVARGKAYAAVYLVERPTGQIYLAIDTFQKKATDSTNP